VATTASRDSYFPLIEKRTGKPMAHWHTVMGRIKQLSYDEQMSCLVDEHGFARAHANALILWTRGSKSSQRVDTPEAYFAALPEPQRTTARSIFEVIQKKHRDLELVIAWNQPMLRRGKDYVFGLSAAKNHLTIAPWDQSLLEAARPMLGGYTVNKKTIQVPSDWKIDRKLLLALVP
jgi:uncharacterized protein YdhG (YjbR/CyaY superfamily)